MSNASLVLWHLRPDGYTVQVMDGDNQPIKEYTEGNSRACSQTYLGPRHAEAVDRKTLRKFAKQTAGEMATEFGLDERSRVWHDADAEKAATEDYRSSVAALRDARGRANG